MTTKASADSMVCGYKSLIKVSKNGNVVGISIVSGCPHIKKYNDNLREVVVKDLYRMEGSSLMKATESKVSPNCIVPAAIMNACWIECGMMSKNLALEKGSLRIIFEE